MTLFFLLPIGSQFLVDDRFELNAMPLQFIKCCAWFLYNSDYLSMTAGVDLSHNSYHLGFLYVNECKLFNGSEIVLNYISEQKKTKLFHKHLSPSQTKLNHTNAP